MAEYADPPGMPEDERMTAAEFRVIREYLGLTGDWLARHLGVNPRTVRSWEQGRDPIPDGVRIEVERLEQQTAEFVGTVVAGLADEIDPLVGVFRSDEEYHAHHPEQPWPASWHRAVVARVAHEVPALRIDYMESIPSD
jgi:transcriptional regulator with XRE-family HTH domain